MPSRIARHLFLVRLAARLALRRLRATCSGTPIPPGLIIELTSACNLRCHGCSCLREGRPERRLSPETVLRLITEASALGIPRISFTGGEPLLESGSICSALERFPHISFSLVTNGVLLTREIVDTLGAFPHIQVMLSTDGPAASARFRSADATAAFLAAATLLKASDVHFGASVRVYRENLAETTSPAFLGYLASQGCSFAVFSPLLPFDPSSGTLTPLTPNDREHLARFTRNPDKPAAIEVLSPCLEAAPCAAGGRVIAVSADGWILPCPHIPWSRHRIPDHSLQEALRSPFFEDLRRPATPAGSPCHVLDGYPALLETARRHQATNINNIA
ncbi:MAG TPA: radical SAM protein [Candidatus Ozemobacteraceae bacterium]